MNRKQVTFVVSFFAAMFVFVVNKTCSGMDSEQGVHLFILSGQSNMQGHRPQEAFLPAVQKEFGEKGVIVVQDALGGQPIQRWYKMWESPEGERPKTTGDLYDRLMSKVSAAVGETKLASITFIWMQGERDAKMKWSAVYEQSLRGLHQQLCDDLNDEDIGFVIGRLSDFDLSNKRYPDWTAVREIQVKVADSSPMFRWVDTDDLNDGLNRAGRPIANDLHYSADGYRVLGQRFAKEAIGLVKSEQ